MRNITDIARALADPTRLKIIALLGRGDYCVNALTRLMNMTQPAVSQHLKVLKTAGLVTPVKKGYWVHYALNQRAVEPFLTQIKKLFTEKGGE
jgi:DNA-binding transcriptional ArsR family regulator